MEVTGYLYPNPKKIDSPTFNLLLKPLRRRYLAVCRRITLLSPSAVKFKSKSPLSRPSWFTAEKPNIAYPQTLPPHSILSAYILPPCTATVLCANSFIATIS